MIYVAQFLERFSPYGLSLFKLPDEEISFCCVNCVVKEKYSINDDLATSFLRLIMNEPSEAIERIIGKEIQKRPLI